jgi:2'-5' RNA ligase
VSDVGRAFVAVVPPPPVLDAIHDAVERVRAESPPGRWTTREQWHVTLQFLGNHVDLGAVADALGTVSARAGQVDLGAVGTFPSERRGRIVWVGCDAGADVLMRAAEAVGAALAPLGHEPEARTFHPHITLARMKPPADVRPLLASLGRSSFGPSWHVDEIVLFRSFTRPTGAEYERVAQVRLEG